MKIESRDLNIEELLSSNNFKIPRFQRPYSWDDENILEFWKDISEAVGGQYFIGSMVVFSVEKGVFGVVDGQQRLTTIMILLSSIRDAFLNIGDVDSATGVQNFIEKRTRDNKKRFVLETETSYPFLQENVLKFGSPQISCQIGDEERSIERAAIILKNEIDAFLKKHSPCDMSSEEASKSKRVCLARLRDTVLDLSVILISLENEENAYLIFETLNTRGKDLSLSDLLKNLFLKNIKDKSSVDHAKITWTETLENLSASPSQLDPDTFLVHSWASRYEAVTIKQAYHNFKLKIKADNSSDHLNEFCRDSKLYRSIFDPTFMWEKSERRAASSLEALRLFKVVQPAPGLLSIVRSYRSKVIKLGKIQEVLKAIENFHFAFTAVTSSRSSGGISGMYSSFGRKLFEAKDSNAAADEITGLIAKLRQRRPVNSEFFANFEGIIYTKSITKQRSLVRYILMRLQEAEKSPTLGREDDLTIEHLYPQSGINEEFSDLVVGQIGNLFLVDEKTNLKLKDKAFSEKKIILQKSGYRLPDLFLESDNLTPELIVRHTQERAALAYNSVWKF